MVGYFSLGSKSESDGMRLITTCPACEATFYVSPEQLSAHRGDVRCGKCNHVFNALDALNQLDQNKTPEVDKTHIEAAETAAVESVVSETQAEEPLIENEVAAEKVYDEVVLDAEPEIQPLQSISDEVAQTESEPEQSDVVVEEAEVPVSQTLVESDDEIAADESVAELSSQPEPEVEKPKASVKPSLVEPIVTKAGAQVASSPTPTFSLDILNGSEKTAVKAKSRISIWLLAFFSLILLLAACLQSAYFLRTEIASQWPITKPYLSRACQQVGCTVELAKHAEFILIEDSDLQEDATYTGVINLSTTLINNAKFIQAYPLLELTLTDTLEKPKLRRTFTPQEYLAKEVDVDKGIAPGEDVEIKLTLTTNGEPVAGYRVFVRY